MPRRLATIALVAATLLSGFMATTFVVSKTEDSLGAVARLRFRVLTDRLTGESQRRVTTIGYGLRGARGFYAAVDSVNRPQLAAYVRSRNLPAEFPGAVGMGFVTRVMRADLAPFVDAERADGAPAFTVRRWPSANAATDLAPDLYVIKHVFPEPAGRAAWGVDIGGDIARRTAIEQAVRSGEATITGHLTLALDGGSRTGFLYFLPVFAHGSVPTVPEAREAALVGLLFAPMVLENVLKGIEETVDGALDFEIYDGDRPTAETRMVSHQGRPRADTGAGSRTSAGNLELRTPVVVGGRTWTFVTRSSPAFEAEDDHRSSVLMGICGGVLSLLLGALVWSLSTSKDRARVLAEKMTRELKVATSTAEAASRAKSEFLTNMSHEIRTPLTAILGFAELLHDDDTDAGARTRRVDAAATIKDAGAHLLTVINDILDLSKIEAEKMTIERIDTPLTLVLREVEGLMRQRAATKHLVLSTALATPIPERIVSDPTRLRQILVNLVGNAVKFTESGSVRVTVGTEERDGEYRLIIDVADTGPGMTHAQSEQLFTAFNQVDGTVTRKHGGTGLGLNICRRLAVLMAGTVSLVTTELGRGSRFRVDLPLLPVAGAPMVRTLDAASPRNGEQPRLLVAKLTGRVLLAEDGPDNQRLIAIHLKKAGACVDVADNGAIALEMIDAATAKQQPYDLLLTDMQMPEMDGYTLARTLRARRSTIAIVALTAHAMAEDRAKCLAAGCDAFVVKPIDRARLLATCAAWIGKSVTHSPSHASEANSAA